MAVTVSSQPLSSSPRPHEDGQDRGGLWLLAGIILVGILVRFGTLDQQSFWFDEAITHRIVAHGIGHVLSSVPKSESTPPLYYVLAWLWSRVFGLGEVGLRSFSALCGTLTIPVVWLLGRKLISARVGQIAALLTAISPLLFWYSQEARAYALVVLLSAISMLALIRALEDPSKARLAQWGVVSALALATHYFALFLIAAQAAWLLTGLVRTKAASLARLACAFLPIVAAASALLPVAIEQNDGRAGFITGHSGTLITRLAQLVKQDVLAFDEPAKVLTSIVALLLVLVALLLFARRTSKIERAGALLPLALGAGTVLLALLAALAGSDYIDTRNLLPSWPALAIVVSAGLGARRAGRLGAATLAALVATSVLCVVGVIADPLFQRGDWRGAAAAMGPATVSRAIVGDNRGGAALEPFMKHLSYFPARKAVQEVDVFALIYRRPGSHASLAPPRPRPAPVLPGFTLVARSESDSYTVLRYRAPTPILERMAALMGLGFVPHEADGVLLQQAGP